MFSLPNFLHKKLPLTLRAWTLPFVQICLGLDQITNVIYSGSFKCFSYFAVTEKEVLQPTQLSY